VRNEYNAVRIEGAHHTLPRGTKYIQRRPMEVTFHDPVEVDTTIPFAELDENKPRSPNQVRRFGNPPPMGITRHTPKTVPKSSRIGKSHTRLGSIVSPMHVRIARPRIAESAFPHIRERPVRLSLAPGTL
jgi:hypothetical protein